MISSVVAMSPSSDDNDCLTGPISGAYMPQRDTVLLTESYRKKGHCFVMSDVYNTSTTMTSSRILNMNNIAKNMNLYTVMFLLLVLDVIFGMLRTLLCA